MENLKFFVIVLAIGFLSGCIKDDFIEDETDPVLQITTQVDTLEINTTFQFQEKYLNNIGLEEAINGIWSSSAPSILSINELGLGTANAIGNATISVSYDNGMNVLKDSLEVVVGETTVITGQSIMGSIATTSSYALSGDFEYRENGDGVEIIFEDNYNASTALPGLYLYLSNNKSTTANALEIGMVEVYNGAHSYTVPNVGFNDYQYLLYFCKPFNVKVGDGEL